MFSAAKKPLSMPMKTGHRLADGEPTVPIVTGSTARAGVTNIHALTRKASPVRADVLMTGMMVPPLSICALIAARRDALPVGRLEPISKSFEEHNEAGKLDKAEEIVGVVPPTNEDPALPLKPG